MSAYHTSRPIMQPLLHIDARRIFRCLVIAILLMSFLSFAMTLASQLYDPLLDSPVFSKIVRVLDIDQERSLPTAYSSLALFGCAVLLALIACVPGLSERRSVRSWQSLSIIFTYLSLDELLSFHEGLIEPIREATGASGLFHFSWIVVAIPCVIAFVAVFFKFWLRLPQQIKRLFLSAMIVFVGGALGLEMINGYYYEHAGNDIFYRFLQHIEELMEMIGIAVFFYALLNYISSQGKRIELVFNVVGFAPDEGHRNFEAELVSKRSKPL